MSAYGKGPLHAAGKAKDTGSSNKVDAETALRSMLGQLQSMTSLLGQFPVEWLEEWLEDLRAAVDAVQRLHLRVRKRALAGLLQRAGLGGLPLGQVKEVLARMLGEHDCWEVHLDQVLHSHWEVPGQDSCFNVQDFVEWLYSPTPIGQESPEASRCTPLSKEAVPVDEHAAQVSERRGLSVHYMATEFVALTEQAGFARDANVYDIEGKVIRGLSGTYTCPRDGRLGCAFVDTVSGEDNVGPATHMLSYTWSYAVSDIVDSLHQWCQEVRLDPKRTYFWICCLCVNQHRVKEEQAAGKVVPFSTFKRVFESRVTTIGRMIALMMPWDSPAYISRSWCMLEMYTALQLEGACELTIRMPQRESEGWTAELVAGRGMQQVYDALREASILKSKCAVSADREQILSLVKNGVGVSEFDRRVKEHLQDWFLLTASKQVRLLPSKVLKTCASVGKLLSDFGRHEDARQVLDFGISHRKSLGNMSPEGADSTVGDLWHESGWLLHKTGELQEARLHYTSGLQELEAMDSLGTLAASRLFRGRARSLIGDEADELFIQGQRPTERDVGLALEDYRRSVHILKALGRSESEDAAKTYNNLGLALSLYCKFDESLAMFEEAGRIRKVLDSLLTPMHARSLCNLGGMHLKHGRITAAEGGDPGPMWAAAARALQEAISIVDMFPEQDSLRPRCVAKLEWLQRRGISSQEG